MSDASKDSHYTHSATIVLKPFPGQTGVTQPHLRRTWMEGTMATFASVGLLGVANGKPSPVAELITDHDLTQIPQLPSTHHGAEKREELRARHMKENLDNDKKRLHISP